MLVSVSFEKRVWFSSKFLLGHECVTNNDDYFFKNESIEFGIFVLLLKMFIWLFNCFLCIFSFPLSFISVFVATC